MHRHPRRPTQPRPPPPDGQSRDGRTAATDDAQPITDSDSESRPAVCFPRLRSANFDPSLEARFWSRKGIFAGTHQKSYAIAIKRQRGPVRILALLPPPSGTVFCPDPPNCSSPALLLFPSIVNYQLSIVRPARNAAPHIYILCTREDQRPEKRKSRKKKKDTLKALYSVLFFLNN